MVDVSSKPNTLRFAHARAIIRLPPVALLALQTNQTHKGNPLQVAILGGIMATKQTSLLIPLCHQIPLSSVDVDCALEDGEEGGRVVVDCKVRAEYHTGVEMEALTGASVASLVVYDMLKAASHGIMIESIHLVEKRGGKRDFQK
ncbi:molybdenum cofactor biosynthesis protein C [Batrachochytrium salamandrivorans]|nr:molybdenum cofactor biosynthesis protein C [Batrachochytrium salamandrivorans]